MNGNCIFKITQVKELAKFVLLTELRVLCSGNKILQHLTLRCSRVVDPAFDAPHAQTG
jgi:hypothetical protein